MPVLRSALVPWLAACLLAMAPGAHAQKQEREASTGGAGLAEVGKGQQGRQGLKPGAYITPKHRQAVQAYLAKHHGAGKPCVPGMQKEGARCVPGAAAGSWVIGDPLPAAATSAQVPAGLLAALPKAPPGNQYVLLGGDILLIASASRIVVDAVPAAK
jgi:hypothetical protein